MDSLTFSGRQSTAQGGDLTVFNRHIAYSTSTAMAIKHFGVSDDQIPLHSDYLPCLSSPKSGGRF
jgi:hypothetical protein